jgi:lysophospholipid acyltransferase (LPLAT)-like uncharacterized protein
LNSKRYTLRKRASTFAISWGAACVVLLLRWTCRVRLHNDPRGALKAAGKRYIYAVLHAHQVSAIVDGEPGTGAMVSRSLDGQIIVPALRVRGIVPVRGSGGRGDGGGRGGREALQALIDHVRGGRPAYLAVDGPRGPRGHVHKGIAVLARQADAAVILMVPVPTRRWILKRAWDRLQIPRPFSRIDGYFAEPLTSEEGESAEAFRARIELRLRTLELEHDPQEAQFTTPAEPEAAMAH